jgi:hypothetical protein
MTLLREGATNVGKSGSSAAASPRAADEDLARFGPADAGGGRTPTDPPIESGGGGGLTRVTVNLNRHAVQALETVSRATGYSKTDTINRALQVYAIVQEIMERDGGALQVRHDDGEVERIHIV